MAVDFPSRAVHGGTGKRQREKTRKNVLDFSASTNPFPPRFTWEPDLRLLGCYPDDDYTELKERIGRVFHRDPAEICVGNGSIELIRVFCPVVFGNRISGNRFYTPSPTFGEYELSARLSGAAPAANPSDAGVYFFCNPNNPTGVLMEKEKTLGLLEEVKRHNGMLFCDEAFIELSDPDQSVADIRDPNLFVLRSLTKSFAVPGIRFGYGFGDPDLVEKIETARSPWSVNAFAESYALEALRHMGELEESRSAIVRERQWLSSEISALGLYCHPSSVNYLLVECGRKASVLCDDLSRRNILVRDCASFGLPTAIRIAVRTREENVRLIEALAACVR